MFTYALFMSWSPYYFYAFPPFSLITLSLQKIEEDQSSGVLLVIVYALRAESVVRMTREGMCSPAMEDS